MPPVDDKKNAEITKRYLELPEDVQNALFAKETSDSILAVGKKYTLSIEKIGELADETGLVMLGITPPSEYIKNLVQRIGVDQEKARAIAEDINQKVFSPVRESLKKIHKLQPETAKPTLPVRLKPQAPSNLPVEQPTVRTLETDLQKASAPPKKDELPSIFVKKMPVVESPLPTTPSPYPDASVGAGEGEGAKEERLKTDLEKALNGEPKGVNTGGGLKTVDPYKEPAD